MAVQRETKLWQPVKDFLMSRGYSVYSEVQDCDLVAVRGDTLVAVELKRTMNLSLVLQGAQRQKAADYVYVAVERPRRRNRRWTQVRDLCRRLGLGLLVVAFPRGGLPRVEVEVEPEALASGRSPSARQRLLNELAGRSGDFNVGGSTRRSIVTVYREEALRIAHELASRGSLSVAALREVTGNERAGSILQKNYYGWFERVRRGVYTLTPAGKQALTAYAEVIAAWDDGG